MAPGLIITEPEPRDKPLTPYEKRRLKELEQVKDLAKKDDNGQSLIDYDNHKEEVRLKRNAQAVLRRTIRNGNRSETDIALSR